MNTKIRWQSDTVCASSVKALQEDWGNLTQHAAEKNIYLFPWYIESSIALLEKKQSQIISIYNDDMLIGLFIVTKDIGYAKLPFIFYRPALHADQFLATPLVHRDFADQFAMGLCQWLDDCPAPISLKMFNLLSADSLVYLALEKICTIEKRPIIIIEKSSRAVIKPQKHSLESAWEALSKGRQKSLTRANKKLSRAGKVEIERLKNSEALEEWLEDFLQLEHAGWKGINKSSTLSITEDADYFKSMVHNAFQNEAMNFFRLRLDSKPIAYTFDLLSKPYGYCHKSAYNQEYRSYSPGVILEYESMKYYLSSDGFDLIDSCTAPDNDMLNSLWPDRREIVTLAVLRSGRHYQWPILIMHRLKKYLRNLKRTAMN